MESISSLEEAIVRDEKILSALSAGKNKSTDSYLDCRCSNDATKRRGNEISNHDLNIEVRKALYKDTVASMRERADIHAQAVKIREDLKQKLEGELYNEEEFDELLEKELQKIEVTSGQEEIKTNHCFWKRYIKHYFHQFTECVDGDSLDGNIILFKLSRLLIHSERYDCFINRLEKIAEGRSEKKNETVTPYEAQHKLQSDKETLREINTPAPALEGREEISESLRKMEMILAVPAEERKVIFKAVKL